MKILENLILNRWIPEWERMMLNGKEAQVETDTHVHEGDKVEGDKVEGDKVEQPQEGEQQEQSQDDE